MPHKSPDPPRSPSVTPCSLSSWAMSGGLHWLQYHLSPLPPHHRPRGGSGRGGGGGIVPSSKRCRYISTNHHTSRKWLEQTTNQPRVEEVGLIS